MIPTERVNPSPARQQRNRLYTIIALASSAVVLLVCICTAVLIWQLVPAEQNPLAALLVQNTATASEDPRATQAARRTATAEARQTRNAEREEEQQTEAAETEAAAETRTAVAEQSLAALETQAVLQRTTAAAQTAAASTAAVAAQNTALALATQGPQLTAAAFQATAQAHVELRAGFRELLFDTMDNEGSKQRWQRGSFDGYLLELRNNVYAITLSEGRTLIWRTWTQRPLGSSYIVELDVAFETPGADTTVGIAFDETDSGNNVSLFRITSDGRWQLLVIRNGAISEQASTDFSSTTAIIGGTNQLRVVRLPQLIELWINNTLVGSLPADQPAGGLAGVTGSVLSDTLDAPASVLTDNFRVLER